MNRKQAITRTIYCCGCARDVEARLAGGREIYPHRDDLSGLPFWKCDACGNHVGCHHKSKDPTQPLGCIPTGEIRQARNHLHRLIDPLWKKGRIDRKTVYAELSARLGYTYHTAEIRSVEQARAAYRAAIALKKSVLGENACRETEGPRQ